MILDQIADPILDLFPELCIESSKLHRPSLTCCYHFIGKSKVKVCGTPNGGWCTCDAALIESNSADQSILVLFVAKIRIADLPGLRELTEVNTDAPLFEITLPDKPTCDFY